MFADNKLPTKRGTEYPPKANRYLNFDLLMKRTIFEYGNYFPPKSTLSSWLPYSDCIYIQIMENASDSTTFPGLGAALLPVYTLKHFIHVTDHFIVKNYLFRERMNVNLCSVISNPTIATVIKDLYNFS